MIVRDFWKTRSFKNFLFHPCEEQKNKLKQQKHREEREIRAIYLTKNILQIQVFRWYEKLNRNLAQIQSWRFLCTGRGWTLIKGKKKTLFYSLELSASTNSADYFIVVSSRLSQVTPFIAIAPLNFIKESTSYIHNTVLGISNTTFT